MIISNSLKGKFIGKNNIIIGKIVIKINIGKVNNLVEFLVIIL